MEETDIFEAIVEWDGQSVAVETDAAETEPLVGMALLYGYRLTLETIDGGQVLIERL
jgi:hypothetical protein